MFGEKLKKASKNISVSETVLRSTREKMMAAVMPVKKKNYYVGRAALALAVVGVMIYAGIFGMQTFSPQQKANPPQTARNTFTLSAYAYEQQENGNLVQKEIDMSQKNDDGSAIGNVTVPEGVQGDFEITQKSDDGSAEEIVTISGGANGEYEVTRIKLLGFHYKGDTIEKVDFKIDSGNLMIPNKAWDTKKLIKNLESKGKELTIDYSTGSPEKQIVYWESEPFTVKTDEKAAADAPKSELSGTAPILLMDSKANITATIHFKDGSQTEKTIAFDSSRGNVVLEEKK